MSIVVRVQIGLDEPSDRDSWERIPAMLSHCGYVIQASLEQGAPEFSKDENQRLLGPVAMDVVEPDQTKAPNPDGTLPNISRAAIIVFRPTDEGPVAPGGETR